MQGGVRKTYSEILQESPQSRTLGSQDTSTAESSEPQFELKGRRNSEVNVQGRESQEQRRVIRRALVGCPPPNSRYCLSREDLSLTRVEVPAEGVTISEEDCYEIDKEYRLLGIFAGRFPGVHAVRSLVNTWPCRVRFTRKPNGYILFQFDKAEHRDAIFEGEDQYVYNKKLFLKMAPEHGQPQPSVFCVKPIWANFPTLPRPLWHPNALSTIASTLGNPICMDPWTLERKNSSTARVLVEMDTSSPFKSMIPIEWSLGKSLKQEVKLEDWNAYCPTCARNGHFAISCPENMPKNQSEEPPLENDKLATSRPMEASGENQLVGKNALMEQSSSVNSVEAQSGNSSATELSSQLNKCADLQRRIKAVALKRANIAKIPKANPGDKQGGGVMENLHATLAPTTIAAGLTNEVINSSEELSLFGGKSTLPESNFAAALNPTFLQQNGVNTIHACNVKAKEIACTGGTPSEETRLIILENKRVQSGKEKSTSTATEIITENNVAIKLPTVAIGTKIIFEEQGILEGQGEARKAKKKIKKKCGVPDDPPTALEILQNPTFGTTCAPAAAQTSAHGKDHQEFNENDFLATHEKMDIVTGSIPEEEQHLDEISTQKPHAVAPTDIDTDLGPTEADTDDYDLTPKQPLVRKSKAKKSRKRASSPILALLETSKGAGGGGRPEPTFGGS